MKYNETTNQIFDEDGDSLLIATGRLNINSNSFNNYFSHQATPSLNEQISPNYIFYTAVEKLLSGDELTKLLCSKAIDAECTVTGKKEFRIKKTLINGTNYDFTDEIDFLNLKRVRKFYINSIPLASSFFGSLTNEQFNAAARNLLKTKIDEELNLVLNNEFPNFICDGGVYGAFDCELLSKNDSEVTINLFDKSYYYSRFINKIYWAGCFNSEPKNYYLFNEYDAEQSLYHKKTLNMQYNLNGTEINIQCPVGYKYIAVVHNYIFEEYDYQAKKYINNESRKVSVFRLLSKEDIKKSIKTTIDSYNLSDLFNPMPKTNRLNLNNYNDQVTTIPVKLGYGNGVINLQERKIYSMDFDDFLNAVDDLKNVYQYHYGYSMLYKAEFPDKIMSVTQKGTNLKFHNNVFEFDLESLDDTDEYAPILVVLETSISPFGIFTWCIPVALVLGILGMLLYLRLPALRVS